MCWEAVSETTTRYAPVPFLCGLFLLAAGGLVYALDRPAGSIELLPPALVHDSGLLGPLAGSLPSFLHAMSFSLMTAALLAPTLRMRAGACGAWLALNWMFEIAQASAFRRTVGIGMAGTFDPQDMLAALLGSACAFLLLQATASRRGFRK